ncbi:MAG: RNA 2',3'-cyclic phosphodiesterase [Gammaproteobacteria bacterium]|nr:RNA 2',3'-cyclic phosphodiesterase [Gammaproteobacteria bacterium]
MRRVFFGLEIPAQIKERLLKVNTEVASAQWHSAEQLHLTLLFLGCVEDEQLLAVREVARDSALAAFELSIAGLGCFGPPHAPKHLWAGVAPEAPVKRLHCALKSQVETLGMQTERRAYCPHLTLARFKHEPGSVEHLLADYRETVFGAFLVEQFVLFESQQSANGSRYTVIERYPLSRFAV